MDVWSDKIGRRGACLLTFAFVDVAIGMSLLSPEAKAVKAYASFTGIAPLYVWSWLWLTVAGVLLFSAFSERDQLGFGAAIAIKLGWAVGFAAAQINGVPRAWLGAAVWVTVALLVYVIAGWPEPRRLGLIVEDE